MNVINVVLVLRWTPLTRTNSLRAMVRPLKSQSQAIRFAAADRNQRPR